AVAAAAGPGDNRQAPKPPAQSSTILDGLVSGGQVRARSEIQSVRGKKTLLVLSANSRRSLEAIDDMQRQVAFWAAKQKDAGIRAEAEAVSRQPIKKGLATTVATALRDSFANVTFADDLTDLAPAKFDYALVLDVDFSHEMGA